MHSMGGIVIHGEENAVPIRAVWQEAFFTDPGKIKGKMIRIKKATEEEYEKVRQFYHDVIHMLETLPYTPGWKVGIYPSDAYLQESISRGELMIGFLEDQIVTAMIVNHAWNESYEKADWPMKAGPEEITVIHALGVRPDFGGRGIAKEMVSWVMEHAGEHHQSVIRLDVLEGNLPAERLYAGLGFQYIDTLQMYYEDTGWTNYKLFEYPLR